VIAYLKLFRSEHQQLLLARLRGTARRACVLLEAFRPRLCGPIWDGTARESTPVTLHLTSDETEAVTRFLLERGIDYALQDSHFRFAGHKTSRSMPRFRVTLGGDLFDLCVFPAGGDWHHPLSTLDSRPMKLANLAALDQLIDSGELFPDEWPALA